jgi:hypothetical protein
VPLDEMNRPRASVDPQLRIPPTLADVERLFAGWREELATCRKFAAAARNYAAARLEADVGLWVNEVRMFDLDDVRWELGRFGKLNVRHGKGSRRKGPTPRLVQPEHHPARRARRHLRRPRLRARRDPAAGARQGPAAGPEETGAPAAAAARAVTPRPRGGRSLPPR